MNDVKLNSVELAPRAGSPASQPQQQSQQVASASKDVDDSSQATKPSQAVDMSEKSQAQQDEQLANAVTKLNDYIQNVQRDLEFQADDSSGKTVITVIDRQTSEVVRQMPDDVALRLAQDLQQDEPLSLFNIKV